MKMSSKDEAYGDLTASLNDLHGTVATFTKHTDTVLEMHEDTASLALCFNSM